MPEAAVSMGPFLKMGLAPKSLGVVPLPYWLSTKLTLVLRAAYEVRRSKFGKSRFHMVSLVFHGHHCHTIVTPLSYPAISTMFLGAQQMRFGPAATTAEARADGPIGRWADGPGMGGIGPKALAKLG